MRTGKVLGCIDHFGWRGIVRYETSVGRLKIGQIVVVGKTKRVVTEILTTPGEPQQYKLTKWDSIPEVWKNTLIHGELEGLFHAV